MSRRQTLFFGLGLIGLALIWTLLQRPQSAVNLVHGPAPELNLQELPTGAEVKLSHYPDKVRLLVFWASWCSPCLAEIPILKQLQASLGPQGLQILGINLDEDRNQALSLMGKIDFNYPILAGTQETVEAYGNFQGIPTSFLINRKGQLMEMIPGMIPEEELQKRIEEALQESN